MEKYLHFSNCSIVHKLNNSLIIIIHSSKLAENKLKRITICTLKTVETLFSTRTLIDSSGENRGSSHQPNLSHSPHAGRIPENEPDCAGNWNPCFLHYSIFP